MKKLNLSINFDEEKFNTLKIYLKKKNSSVESETEKFLESLYLKIVPANVREFINMKNGSEKAEPKSATKKAVKSQPAQTAKEQL